MEATFRLSFLTHALSQSSLKQYIYQRREMKSPTTDCLAIAVSEPFKFLHEKKAITPLHCIHFLGQRVWSSLSLSAPSRCLLVV